MHPESIVHAAVGIANHLRMQAQLPNDVRQQHEYCAPPLTPDLLHVSDEAQPAQAKERVVHVRHVPRADGYPTILVVLTIQYVLSQPGRVYPSHPTDDGQRQEYRPAVANFLLLDGR